MHLFRPARLSKSFLAYAIPALLLLGLPTNECQSQDGKKTETAKSKVDEKLPDALATRQDFEFEGHAGFLMQSPANKDSSKSKPWVWYAPTLGKNLPGSAEKWMFDRFHKAGISIAGINVGESYGSPEGRQIFQKFYAFLTAEKGYSAKPVLLARSRGGLMLYSWANEHPKSVGGIAGIYPVCNLTSYPGLKTAAKAYKMSAEELESNLSRFNPIERLSGLAENKVPIFHIHGDSDKVVPLNENSAIVRARYNQLKGPIEVEVVKGQGHNMWKGWFTSKRLLTFVLRHAK